MKKEIEEAWLHAQVGPAFDALKADLGRAVTTDQVRARLADITQAIKQLHRVDGDIEPLTPFDPTEDLTTAEAVAAFLADAKATADPSYIEHARQVVARARTMHGITS